MAEQATVCFLELSPIPDLTEKLSTKAKTYSRLILYRSLLSFSKTHAFQNQEPQLIVVLVGESNLEPEHILCRIHQLCPDSYKILIGQKLSITSIISALNYGGVSKCFDLSHQVEEIHTSMIEGIYLVKNNKKQLTSLRKLQDRNDILERRDRNRRDKLRAERTGLIQKIEWEEQGRNIQSEELNLAFSIIDKKNKEITSSIRYAKTIQDSMLPKNETISSHSFIKEHFLIFKPKDVVSGDFYWMTTIPSKPVFAESSESNKNVKKVFEGLSNEKTVFVFADCTGHGVPGGFMSIIGIGLLKNIIEEKGIDDPSAILLLLDKGIKSILQQDSSDNCDGMDLGICVFDKVAEQITYAGAKTNLHYFDETGYSEVKGENRHLGMTGFSKKRKGTFRNHLIKWNSEMTIYMMSDGYKDQIGGESRRRLGKLRMIAFLKKAQEFPISKQKSLFDELLEEWRDTEKQTDDVMFIGLKV